MNNRLIKLKAYSKSMHDRLIVADFKICLLKPLLYNEELIAKWDNSISAHGLNLLSSTLYHDIIRELSAISFDSNKKSPSIENIINLLNADDLRQSLKEEYATPPKINFMDDVDETTKTFIEERHKESSRSQGNIRFDNTYSKVLSDYKGFKESSFLLK